MFELPPPSQLVLREFLSEKIGRHEISQPADKNLEFRAPIRQEISVLDTNLFERVTLR